MPRQMPNMARAFADSATIAMDFARGVESARMQLSVVEARQHLPVTRIELAYELAYLRMFTAWEDFLEQSLLRYMCGYVALHGQEQPVGGHYCATLSAAKATLYGHQHYLLWHNPNTVTNRAARVLHQSRHETVLASIQGRMEHFAAIRHRIAHAHASSEFDAATMALAGKRYRGSRPGRFLRDWAPHAPVPTRWMDMIAVEFQGLAFQIVPT
jgi:hypothetical protein